MGIVASRLGRGSNPSAERPRGRNAQGGGRGQTRGRPELRVRQQGMSRSQRDARKRSFSPAVSVGGHGALLKGGVKDARRIPQPPPAVGHDVHLRGGASISTFASPRQSRSSTTTLGGRLAWHGRQRTPSSKWVRGIRLCTRRSFRLSFALSSDQQFKNKARVSISCGTENKIIVQYHVKKL